MDIEKREDYTKTIAIVRPVLYPAKIAAVPEAHSTTMFLGMVDDAWWIPSDLEGVVVMNGVITATVTGPKHFGPDNDVPVLLLASDELHKDHDNVENSLNVLGIKSASEFGYSPHVTVTEELLSDYPAAVLLGPGELWWGTEKIPLGSL